jgi:hypothetical protein
MLIVCLALIAALIAVTVALAGLLGRQQRAHDRREDLLVNQILHLSGRTWTPPPADEWGPAKDGEPLVREWTAQPEQHPYTLAEA